MRPHILPLTRSHVRPLGDPGHIAGSSLAASLLVDLVGAYKLDAGQGFDQPSSGGTTIGEFQDPGNVSSATGKVGFGADFESSAEDYLQNSAPADFRFTGSFTITLWFKPESLPSGTRFLIANGAYANGGTGCYSIRVTNTGGVGFFVNDGAGTNQGVDYQDIAAAAAVANGNWYFFAARCDVDADTISLNVTRDNGSVTGTASGGFTGTVNAGAQAVRIGADGTSAEPAANTFIDGVVDAVTFHNRALSDDELTYLFNNGDGREYPFA